jgi:hypothetical protein
MATDVAGCVTKHKVLVVKYAETVWPGGDITTTNALKFAESLSAWLEKNCKDEDTISNARLAVALSLYTLPPRAKFKPRTDL